MNTKYLVLVALLIHPGLAAAHSTPPHNPSGLALAPTADGTGTLVSWRRGSPGQGSPGEVAFSHYQVQRSFVGFFINTGIVDVGPQITDPTITTFTALHTATDIIPNIGYRYRVLEVYTEVGADHTHTGESNEVQGWIHFISGANNQVDNLRAEVLDGGARIRLTWDEPTTPSPIMSYNIALPDGSGDFTNADVRSYTYTSPAAGIYNQYRVSANFQGTSGPGALISVLTPPAIPNNVEVVLGADGEFTVNWDPSIGATEYKIERGSVTTP